MSNSPSSSAAQAVTRNTFSHLTDKISKYTLPIYEREYSLKKHIVDDVDRSQWKIRLFKDNPDFQLLIESTIPLSRTIQFCLMYNPWTAEAHHYVNNTKVIDLICEYLYTNGFTKSLQRLQTESRSNFFPSITAGDPSRLMLLCREAVRKVDTLYSNMAQQRLEPEEKQKLIQNFIESNLNLKVKAYQQEDINIWQEPDECDANVLYMKSDGNHRIKAANFNVLLSHLIPLGSLDRFFLKTFLLTFQSFTTPSTLLARIIDRYHIPESPPEGFEGNWEETRSSVQLKACNALRTWINKHYYDFNEFLINEVTTFIEEGPMRDGNQHLGVSILKTLTKKKNAQTKKRAHMFDTDAPEPKIPKKIFHPNLTLLDCPDEELVRQLTLIDHGIYSNIRPPELLNLAWSKPKYRHRAPNVLAMTNLFNKVAGWVSYSILSFQRVRDRAKMIARFVHMLQDSRILNNFNSVFAILAGLSNASIFRLEFTWGEVSRNKKQLIEEFKALISSRSSYAAYRNALKTANPPCLPYLGVYLTDLTFTEDGNKDFITIEDVILPPPKPKPVVNNRSQKTDIINLNPPISSSGKKKTKGIGLSVIKSKFKGMETTITNHGLSSSKKPAVLSPEPEKASLNINSSQEASPNSSPKTSNVSINEKEVEEADPQSDSSISPVPDGIEFSDDGTPEPPDDSFSDEEEDESEAKSTPTIRTHSDSNASKASKNSNASTPTSSSPQSGGNSPVPNSVENLEDSHDSSSNTPNESHGNDAPTERIKVDLINFQKREMLAKIIADLQQYQQQPYNLTPVQQIQNLFATIPDYDSNELYKISLLREPRKATADDILW